MRYLRFVNKKGEDVYGIIEGEKVFETDLAPYEENAKKTGDEYLLKDVKILPPSDPQEIFCIGTNYMDHIRETKAKFGTELPIPSSPIVFSKGRNTIAGHLDEVIYPTPVEKLGYEGELGVIIGKKCYQVSKEEALDYVAGYTCANDVSARDFQFGDGQWTRGKGLDKFCPFGPVVTDEIDPFNTKIRTRLNGVTVQDGTTSDMIFSVPEIISFITEWITLQPGDLIITGTPDGVGQLKVGDEVEIDIEGIGVLKNTIVSAEG